MDCKKNEVPFTRIPQVFLKVSKEHPLTPFEFRVVCLIYDYTIGFNRVTWILRNVRISEETGICKSKVGKIIKNACDKAKIKLKKLNSGYKYEVTVLPLRKESITPKVTYDYPKGNGHYPKGNVSRTAIDNSIDNIIDKERYLFLKNKYPEVKWNEPVEEWNSLTDQERIDLSDVIDYQLNLWNLLDDTQFIPKASDYISKNKFKDEKVFGPLKNKRRRLKERVEQEEYLKKAEENTASNDEVKEILNRVKLEKTS